MIVYDEDANHLPPLPSGSVGSGGTSGDARFRRRCAGHLEDSAECGGSLAHSRIPSDPGRSWPPR